jgi:Fungal specific transcription factor domain/Fungal Zn(2)-Cys(6) binuclear cluster domain
MPPDKAPARHARTACLPCRRSKRRCDKKIPICYLCAHKEVECSYPARYDGIQQSIVVTPDSFSPDGHQRTHERLMPSLGLPPLVGSDINAIYFIAPHFFQQTRLQLPRPNLPVPIEVSSLVGDVSSIHSIASIFFTTIHRWLPIVSKQGFFAFLLNPITQRQVELSLLTLCMKLCCAAPTDEGGDGGTRTALYRTVKRFYNEVEMSGVLSIPVLQAGILIALYELGQAIYPAAYLSVGACARYGLALRLDKLSSASIDNGDVQRPWDEVEERRRVWWAVLMFDR